MIGESVIKKHMINKMAVVRITSYTRNRGEAKASIRYITHRPGKDGRVTSRPLYTFDGEVSKLDAYQMIDDAQKGSVFFRIVISPDAKQEDTRKDLYLWQITEQTMLTLEERLNIHVPFTAAEHNDHTGNRHVHLLACLKGRIEKADLKALREAATDAALAQRQERDLAWEAKFRAVEEAQWAL
jgi:hypothetical protein